MISRPPFQPKTRAQYARPKGWSQIIWKTHILQIRLYFANMENRIIPNKILPRRSNQISTNKERKIDHRQLDSPPIRKEDYPEQTALSKSITESDTNNKKISSNGNKSQSLSNWLNIYYKYMATPAVKGTHSETQKLLGQSFFSLRKKLT